jgi:hypothetical protein
MAGLDELNNELGNVVTNGAAAGLVMGKLQEQAKNISIDGLKSSINKSIDSLFKLQDNIIKTSRGLGQSAAQAKLMETEIGKAAINAVEMGGNLEDVVKNFEQINTTLGRTTYLSSSVLTNIEAIQKFGVADTTIQSFAKFFDKVGGGMDASIQQQIELVNTAKDYGLNVGQFLGSVAGKLDIVNKYGFPKGVSDLASMVAKSQVLGDSLSVAQNFADQIMDSPEKAYEYAAQLQTLGGSFSQLGDGAQLLYMAQNDLKGLNDQLINATRGIATFNEESGQFEISANERLRLRGLKNLGIDADKIEETALKLAKQEQIIGKLNLNPNIAGMSDEEKETLANYAQLQKGGIVTIKGEEIGGLDSKSISEIMTGLQGKGSQLSNESEKNVQMIQSNMSAQEASTVQTNLFSNAIALSVLKIGDFSKTLDTVTAAQTQIISSIRGATVGGETADKLIKSFEDNIKNTSLLITKALDTFTSSKIKSEAPPAPLTVTGAAKIEVDVKGLDLKFADAIKPAIVDAVLEEMKKKGYSK